MPRERASPNPVGDGRPDGGGVGLTGGEAMERQKHGLLYLYDLGDPPADEKGRRPELLGPRR